MSIYNTEGSDNTFSIIITTKLPYTLYIQVYVAIAIKCQWWSLSNTKLHLKIYQLLDSTFKIVQVNSSMFILVFNSENKSFIVSIFLANSSSSQIINVLVIAIKLLKFNVFISFIIWILINSG